MKKKPSAPINAATSLKRSFSLIGLFLFSVIIINLVGLILILRLNSEREKAKQMADLIHHQKVAYTLFMSASTNSVIGLSTKNWDFLLKERKIVNEQIKAFEYLGHRIKFSMKGLKNEKVLDDHLEKILRLWSDVKKQNVIILRTKSSELEKNEALPDFVISVQRLEDIYEDFEKEVLEILNDRQSAINSTTQKIYYLNFAFLFLSIPFLIFAIFRPSLRRERELELARAQNISLSKLSSLGEMAAGIAHEINTPLAVIILNANHALKVLQSGEVDQAVLQKKLELIKSTTERIAKIIRGLQIFARDASNDPLKPVNVSVLIDDTLSFCLDRFKQESVELKIEGDVKDLWFNGRVTEIAQVLLNLLNNSLDAIAGNDEKWVVISAIATSDFIEISVTDSGKGLSEYVKSKLFEPFFTTKEVGKGTGMGLSISSRILKNHGGNLYYDESNSNTRFVMQLPKSRGDGQAP